MNDDFDEVGLGIREGTSFSEGRDWNGVMTTENFARSSTTPGPVFVGVVYRDTNQNGLYDPGEGVGDVTVKVGDGVDSAITTGSGGYFLPYSGTGDIAATFQHATLGSASVKTTRTGKNVKLDWIPSGSLEPPTLLLSVVQPTNNGPIQIQIGGIYRGDVRVERSVDFSGWEPAGMVTKKGDTVGFSETTGARRWAFYRALGAQ